MQHLPMISLRHHRQENSASCLAACVVMILGHHHVEMAESDARRLLKTKPYSGAHPINLLQLSEFGFDAWPYEGTVAELKQRVHGGVPVITFLWTAALRHWAKLGGIDYLHAVVVAGFDESIISIHDPAMQDGPMALSWSEFKDAWQYSRQMMAVIVPRRTPDELAP